VKNILRKTFGVNYSGTRLDLGSALAVCWQRELDINLDIHDQANGSLITRDNVVYGFPRTAEFQTASRDIKYICRGQLATRLSNFAGQISIDTMVFSIASKVLLRICVQIHVSDTRRSGIVCGPVVNLLCLITD